MTGPLYDPGNEMHAGHIAHYRRMKTQAARRDVRMNLIYEVRMGRMREMFPDHLTEVLGHDGLAIANWIDTVGQDVSEVLAPLPTLNCAAGQMRTDADKRRAEKKNRIGSWYWRSSNLENQMMWGANWYYSYGFLPAYIDPDFDRKTPIIILEDPMGVYYERDRFGCVTSYVKETWRTIDELCALYPEFEGRLRKPNGVDGSKQSGSQYVQVVRWEGKNDTTLFIPERAGLILDNYHHGLGRVKVRVAQRPGISSHHTRGQFDDVVTVQLARAIMAGFGLEAAEQAVNAPIALPPDVNELATGPGAVIQTDQPGNVRRVQLDLPPAAFQESQLLQDELKIGSRYPDARLGQMNASVITGKGVQAMMGTFDSQLKSSQTLLGHMLKDITHDAFEADEKWFPNTPKKINGLTSGRTYEMTYVPKKDIAGNYMCDVTYGFAAGMQPSQMIVTLLQLRGDADISRSTLRNNLPIEIDDEHEQRLLDVESTRDALKQGVFGLMSSIGPMIEQGMDPTPIVQAVTEMVDGRQDGQTLEAAVSAALAAMQQAKQQAAQQAAAAQAAQAPPGGAPAGPGGPGGPPGAGGGPDDMAPQAPPGQAGMPPGGMPAIQQLVAGIRGAGNTPVLQDTVSRRVPVQQ